MQILGGVLGAAMSKYLTMGNVILSNPGCFGPNFGIGGGQIFFWELTTTFVLVSVVFATAVDDAASGHFVSVAPLAIGLSLFACAQASGPFTGGCLNPARFLGPAIVFGCGWPWFPPYVFGQLLGGGGRLGLVRVGLGHAALVAGQQQSLRRAVLHSEPKRLNGRDRCGLLRGFLLANCLQLV